MPTDAAITKLEGIPILALKGKKWTAKDFLDYLKLRDQLEDLRRFAVYKIV